MCKSHLEVKETVREQQTPWVGYQWGDLRCLNRTKYYTLILLIYGAAIELKCIFLFFNDIYQLGRS